MIMAHVDIFEVQNKLSRQTPIRNWRRQLMGAGFILLLGGGYAAWHASAKPEATPAPAPVAVAVETLHSHAIAPFAQFSGRINAVDYAEIRPQVAGRITEMLKVPERLAQARAAALAAAKQAYCWELYAPRLVARVERALAA